MGVEFRSILLDEAETRAAVAQLLDSKGGLARGGDVAGIMVSEGPDCRARVALRHPLLDGRQAITLDPEALIEAAVGYCQARAVPLPKSGRKRVEKRPEGLQLMIEVNWF